MSTALSPPRVVVVVPCYNEEDRLDESAFRKLAEHDGLRLLFVDDGSTDGTSKVLARLQEQTGSIGVRILPVNSGKAEAVRQGLIDALASGSDMVGYLDADMATPGSEMVRMIQALERDPGLTAVFGCRVARLGSTIDRSAFRHYMGRLFATVASMALGVAVYDTQCGAKVFRATPALAAAIERPFRSPWSFDVLLCQRLLDGTAEVPGLPKASFLELPLEQWFHRPGSKLDPGGSAMALIDVVRMGAARRITHGRRGPGGTPP